CHGPSQGNKITFTRPDTRVPEWKGIPEPDQAAHHAIAAYLGAYGPATPEVFNAWLLRGALKKTVVRRWFADLGDKLTKVDVEGADAYIRSEHADDLARIKPSKSGRLLGAFDQYVLGPGTKDRQILAPEHRAKVSKTAGWIAPIVVVSGRITGVWELTDNEVSVSFFPGATKPSAQTLETEVAQVARASGTDNLRLRVL
ncbi:MAG: DNA glycosylase AlkZ-like family protein, partial [Pseudonocardiaceae bacterium]